MNKKLYIIITAIIVTVVAVFSILYFVNRDNTNIDEVTNLTFTDSEGYEITFEEVPEKVISLIASATETVYDLDKGENLIAVDTYSNYPADTENKEKLETGTNLNIESIIALNPDVIFMSKMGQTTDQYNSLVNAGLKIVMVDATSLKETYEVIELIGGVLGEKDKAVNITTEMKNEIESIKESIKDKESKTLYYEISPLQYGLWTSGNGTFENEIMELLKINNIFSDVKSWSEVSEEQVLERNPEYIVTTSTDYSGFNAVDEINLRENWSDITAIKDGNVYQINADIMSRPTKRLVEGMKELKNIVYED